MRVSQRVCCSGVPPTRDRLAAEEGREHARRDAEVDARQLLADPVEVERARRPSRGESSGMKKRWIPSSGPHMARIEVGGELVARVQTEKDLVGEPARRELAQRGEARLERFGIQTGHGDEEQRVCQSTGEAPPPGRAI